MSDAESTAGPERSETDLSVSIVNANSRKPLLACLESMRASLTDQVRVEIVVLDNASDDGSADAVRNRFPDVHVIEQEFRTGFAVNQNKAIRATTGRYVYLVNPDTLSADWAFARLVAELDAHPQVAALGPRLIYPDGKQQDSAWRFPTPVVSVLGLLTIGRLPTAQSVGDRSRSVDWLMGSAMVLRRRALVDVGLFDESFFMYFEETDLCLRLRKAGWDVCYFPAVSVVHQKAESTSDIPDRRINEWWRGHHRYWRKHHSRAGARTAALALGVRYVGAGLAGRRDSAHRARMWLHARNSLRVPGPGLRELAEEWNRTRAPDAE
jgi:GT2 family glycosyltransferase